MLRAGREAEMRDRFLEVAAAFELLTDEDSRRDFDSRGTYQRPTTKTYKRRTQKKHAPLTDEEERAAARVLNVRSRKHLEDAALGVDGRVDRHFVLALYDEGECEDYLTFTTRFPYPFADKPDPHGIWWEDVLQTAKTRLTDADGEPSRIAKKLNLDVRRGCPQVVFAGNGTDLFTEMDVLHRPTRQSLEEWLWPKLQTRVRFENDSPHTIRTWWVHGGHAKDPMDVAPGATLERNAYVSHLFAVRDARAGGPLTKESCLNWQHVDSDANPFVSDAASTLSLSRRLVTGRRHAGHQGHAQVPGLARRLRRLGRRGRVRAERRLHAQVLPPDVPREGRESRGARRGRGGAARGRRAGRGRAAQGSLRGGRCRGQAATGRSDISRDSGRGCFGQRPSLRRDVSRKRSAAVVGCKCEF